jgi:Cytidylyltransferase
MITPRMIETALGPLRSDQSISCVNLVHRITSQQEFLDPNTIKVVADANCNALYFSRSPIPHVNFEQTTAKIFRQVCVIPFTRPCLQVFKASTYAPRAREAEVVQGIVRYVISQHRSVRLVSRFVELTKHTPIPALLTLLAWTRSFLAVIPEGPLVGVAWIARLSNERRALEPLITLSPEFQWTELKFQSRVSMRAALKLTLRDLKYIPRVYKIGRRMHRQFESFKAMRVVELLGYYTRYVELFGQGNFALALTSNHSNPHGIAFNLAARKFGVPIVFVSHGMPVRPVARLKYDLAVVHSEAAGKTYADEGCEIDRLLIHGRKQDHVPMRTGPLPPQVNVGIFLCKEVNDERLKTLVENLLASDRVTRIPYSPASEEPLAEDRFVDSFTRRCTVVSELQTDCPGRSNRTGCSVRREFECADRQRHGRRSERLRGRVGPRLSGPSSLCRGWIDLSE